MEHHNDDQLLKKMVNFEACYHKLMKDIEVKDDGFSHRILKIYCAMNVGKKYHDQHLCIS